jgi:hypothetical protein
MGDPARSTLRERVKAMRTDKSVSAARVAAIDGVLTAFLHNEVAGGLKKMHDSLQTKVAAEAAAMQETEEAVKRELASLETVEATQRGLIDIARTDEAEKKARADYEVTISKERILKDDLEQKKRDYRLSSSILLSHLAQMSAYLAEPERHAEALLPVIQSGAWDPRLLPFEHQVKAKISFELVDIPLSDIVTQYKAMCGLTLDLDPKIREPQDMPALNLRVTDMSADLALSWVCRLMEVEFTVDSVNRKILIHKPGAETQKKEE